jgi:GMP synthase-like glutamine amidotransferase
VQLLAASLGAEIRPSEPPEVGLLPVELTDEGRRDPLFAGLEERLVSLQWHGDTFDLPEGAVRLARSDLVPNQAFRSGQRAYGVQFHLEVTPEMALEWAKVPAYRESLAENLGEEEGNAFLREVEQRATEFHPHARRLFSNWLDVASA